MAWIYIRGQKQDFDLWDPERKYGWDYNSISAYFKKSEKNMDIQDQYHGSDGELSVSSPKDLHPLAFFKKRIIMGYPLNKDFNGVTQEGFGHLQMTIKNGLRSSSSTAFLESG